LQLLLESEGVGDLLQLRTPQQLDGEWAGRVARAFADAVLVDAWLDVEPRAADVQRPVGAAKDVREGHGPGWRTDDYCVGLTASPVDESGLDKLDHPSWRPPHSLDSGT
jgi:hypothetical protein